jgi:hypothetical protein
VFCRSEGGEQRKALLLIVSFVVELFCVFAGEKYPVSSRYPG